MDGVRQDAVLTRVAERLGLRVLGSLEGGQFGACLVADADGSECVLKALDSPAGAPQWRRAAELAERMRLAGYPAPRYRGVGEFEDATWSLQERLPGEVPARASEAHVRQLVDLSSLHAGMAPGEGGGFQAHIVSNMERARLRLTEDPRSAHLAEELSQVVILASTFEFRTDDVVHYDFHKANYLAAGDEVTGVFDWEGARPGDWRCDLANLAVTVESPGVDEALEQQEPEAVAVFVAWHLLRYLEFDLNTRPDRPDWPPEGVGRLSRWWRASN